MLLDRAVLLNCSTEARARLVYRSARRVRDYQSVSPEPGMHITISSGPVRVNTMEGDRVVKE